MSATTLTPTRKGSVVSEAKSPSPAKQTFGCSMSLNTSITGDNYLTKAPRTH